MQSRAWKAGKAQRCMAAPELSTWSAMWPQPIPQGASNELSSRGKNLIVDIIFIFSPLISHWYYRLETDYLETPSPDTPPPLASACMLMYACVLCGVVCWIVVYLNGDLHPSTHPLPASIYPVIQPPVTQNPLCRVKAQTEYLCVL